MTMVDLTRGEYAVCPICGEACGTVQRLLNHVKAKDDDEHRLLMAIRDVHAFKMTEFVAARIVYHRAFDTLDKDGFDAAVAFARLVKAALDEAHAYAVAYLRDRRYERIRAAADERAARRAEEREAARVANEIAKRDNNRFFRSLPSGDRPAMLVDFFYSLVDRRSTNVCRDVQLVKGLFTKSGLDPDEIRNVMRYMAAIGAVSLARVNYVLDDALEFIAQRAKMATDGSAASLVQIFYNLRGVKPSVRTFVREVRMIEAAMTHRGVTYDHARRVIEMMAREPDVPLLWFDTRVGQLTPVARRRDDPCVAYSNEREVAESVRSIVAGKIRLTDVGHGVRSACAGKLEEILRSGAFDQRYSYTEWAFKVGMSLDGDLLKFSKANDATRTSWFSNALQRCQDADKRVMIEAKRREYVAWLAGQAK